MEARDSRTVLEEELNKREQEEVTSYTARNTARLVRGCEPSVASSLYKLRDKMLGEKKKAYWFISKRPQAECKEFLGKLVSSLNIAELGRLQVKCSKEKRVRKADMGDRRWTYKAGTIYKHGHAITLVLICRMEAWKEAQFTKVVKRDEKGVFEGGRVLVESLVDRKGDSDGYFRKSTTVRTVFNFLCRQGGCPVEFTDKDVESWVSRRMEEAEGFGKSDEEVSEEDGRQKRETIESDEKRT